MNVSQKGIDLIKSFEGFRSKMYLDSAGLPTIGYGTLIDSEKEKHLMTATIDEDTAERFLRFDVEKAVARMQPIIKSVLNQNQYDALVSFAYNVGVTALRKSTLLAKVNANPNDATIRNEFLKWSNAGGKRVQGLYNRRVKEAELYFS
jgi:lysozyme